MNPRVVPILGVNTGECCVVVVGVARDPSGGVELEECDCVNLAAGGSAGETRTSDFNHALVGENGAAFSTSGVVGLEAVDGGMAYVGPVGFGD